MKLQEIKEASEYSSGKLSTICLWLSSITLPIAAILEFRLIAFFAVLVLFLHIEQYQIQAYGLQAYYDKHYKDGVDDIDNEVKEPRTINNIAYIFHILKVLMLLIMLFLIGFGITNF